MRSDMKRHMQMHARDGSDVSLLLACAEQGIDPLEAITADPDALAALREKTAYSTEVKTPAPRATRGSRKVFFYSSLKATKYFNVYIRFIESEKRRSYCSSHNSR